MAGTKSLSLEQLKNWFLKAFVFLGPLGNLLTPQLVTNSFRTYYLILLGFPLFWIRLPKRVAKLAVFAAPIFIYCFFSSAYVYLIGCDDMPFSRLALFISQSLFIIGVATSIERFDQVLSLIRLYLKSFFLSLAIGYVFYAGYYLSVIPLSVLDYFSVLTQMGYGFLRFSPGSYPNEYGMVASFVLSILTWILLGNEKLQNFSFFSKKKLFFFFGLTLIALLLTTTRSAYLSYSFILCYLALKKRKLLKVVGMVSFGTLTISALLACFGINIFDVLRTGFSLDNFEIGSLGERFIVWKNAYESFSTTPLIGTGFSSQSSLHNLYLQILFELGILGVILLIGMVVCFFLGKGYIRLRRRTEHNVQEEFIRTTIIIGFVHVLWFAASNHNLNHHLTWFAFFLFLSSSWIRNRYFIESMEKVSRYEARLFK